MQEKVLLLLNNVALILLVIWRWKLTYSSCLLTVPQNLSRGCQTLATFQRHSIRLHLQNDVYRHEHGNVYIYKVEPLDSLKWSVAAWGKISTALVANCFSHTGLIVLSPLPYVASQKEHLVERVLQGAINIRPFRNFGAIFKLINQVEEDKV